MSETTGGTPLDNRLDTQLAAALDGVTLAVDASHATVRDREITADTARQLRQELIGVVYETCHVGHVFGTERPRSFRDPWLEERLIAGTPHTTTSVAAILRPPAVAVIDGVRVQLATSAETEQASGSGRVRLPAGRPACLPQPTGGWQGGVPCERIT
ncbi:hypothetical protein [Streptomyces sp. KR80]|uniref:hypothetical protein n=1 Tax=Streptomyces sp. KR80 TaxID=3457426 RepID=UPI003FD3B205